MSSLPPSAPGNFAPSPVPLLGSHSLPETAGPHIVIVGGGFGGLTAAQSLRKAPARVTVIDRTNHHVFQPLLYQVATAGLSPADIAAPIRAILHKQANTDVRMAEVTGVDTARRLVLMGDHALPFDFLILATGARHSYFGHPEWESLAPGLKSLTDATTIRRKILVAFERAENEEDAARRIALLTFAIVGGGPTGVEMAGMIAEVAQKTLRRDFRHIDPTQAQVLLLEGGERLLPAFPAELAAKATAALEKMGVTVRCKAMVQGVDADGVTVNGSRVACGTVIWAAGNMASPAGRWLGAETDRAGRVKVNADLTVPGHADIFVIGDTMLLAQDGTSLPGVAQVAMQQGKYAAQVISARLKGGTPPAGFRYWDKGNLATVGRRFAIADLGRIKLAGFVAWVLWLTIHLVYLIGFRNRAVVMLSWAWSYVTYQRGARLITGDMASGAVSGVSGAAVAGSGAIREASAVNAVVSAGSETGSEAGSKGTEGRTG